MASLVNDIQHLRKEKYQSHANTFRKWWRTLTYFMRQLSKPEKIARENYSSKIPHKLRHEVIVILTN